MKPIKNDTRLFPNIGDTIGRYKVVKLVHCLNSSRCETTYRDYETCGGYKRVTEESSERQCCYRIKFNNPGKPLLFVEEDCKEGTKL